MIKVAQIGVGYWGPNLLRNLVASKRCKVARVVDLSPERQEYVRGLYPAVNVTDKVENGWVTRRSKLWSSRLLWQPTLTWP